MLCNIWSWTKRPSIKFYIPSMCFMLCKVLGFCGSLVMGFLKLENVSCVNIFFIWTPVPLVLCYNVYLVFRGDASSK